MSAIEDGIYRGMPEKTYRDDPRVSHSALSNLSTSALYAEYVRQHKQPATPQMVFGSALHCFVLERDEFRKRFTVAEGIDRRTKAGREDWAALCAEFGEENILKEEDFNRVQRCAKSLLDHPAARAVIDAATDRELSLFWSDLETRIPVKSRLDIFAADHFVADIKTIASAHPKDCEKAIFDRNYFTQAALYLRAAASLGIEVDNFILVFVESSEPFDVCVCRLRDDVIAEGGRRVSRWLRRWRDCEASGKWPGYSDRIVDVGIPLWAVKQLEEENKRDD